MTNPSDPFELEPEAAPDPPQIARPAPPREELPPKELPPKEVPPKEVPAPHWTPDGEPEVDTRTVAERTGTERPRGTEALGDPSDWPKEALQFPLRAPGGAFLVVGFSALYLFDLVGLFGGLLFLAWIAKLLVFAYLLRGQFHVIGTSAAGDDRPRGWEKALQFDRDDLVQYGWTLLAFTAALAPGLLLYAFDRMAAGILLLALGSMYAAVVALGASLQDRRLKWPWHAFAWMGRRPLYCLVGSVGWWILWVGEFALSARGDEALVLTAFVALVLRAAGMYALLVSARVLGVMGRSWTGGQ